MEDTLIDSAILKPGIEKAASGRRFQSLDVFRGVTLALMIIVNSPGKGAPFFPFLIHAQWFGFTLADLVFPSFLFAVGSAMSFSFPSRSFVGNAFLRKVFVRSALIFLIGYLMYWFPFVKQDTDGIWHFISIDQTRIMGVLQRIAICYLIASLLVQYCSIRIVGLAAGVILILYWGLLMWFGDTSSELTMAGNAITKFDLWLLGEGHVYKKDLIPFDPEGLLSTLPSVVNVLAGYGAGMWLQKVDHIGKTVKQLLIAGIVCVVAGLGWGFFFPISKKLWTSSFVLLTVGLDLILLSSMVFLFEWRKWFGSARFFTIMGTNSLVVYLFSELFFIVLSTIKLQNGQTIFTWVSLEWFQRLAPGSWGALLTAIVFMLLCWLLAWLLDRNKIYVKV